MSAPAYNRGSRLLARELDDRTAVATSRAGWQAEKTEVQSLRERIVVLERELSRARRCLAAERNGRCQLKARLEDEERRYAFAIGILCRRAFPGEATP